MVKKTTAIDYSKEYRDLLIEYKKLEKQKLAMQDALAKEKADNYNLNEELEKLRQIIADLREAIQWLAKKYLGKRLESINCQGRLYKL